MWHLLIGPGFWMLENEWARCNDYLKHSWKLAATRRRRRNGITIRGMIDAMLHIDPGEKPAKKAKIR